jgi:hypothetical protein
MKLNILLTAIAISAATNSHAQTPAEPLKPLPVTEERNAAVGFALAQMQFVSSLLSACSRLDETAADGSKLAWSDWLRRNSAYLEGARGWVLYVRALATARSGPQAGAALQAKIADDVSVSAKASLLEILPGGEPQAVACEKWLKLVADPRMDVRASKEFGAELEAIRAFHQAVLQRAPR